MTTKIMHRVIAVAALLTILSGCDAPEAKARLECSNNLKLVGLALVLEAQVHDNVIPQSLASVASSNYANSPSVLVCPGDKRKRGMMPTNWNSFDLTNVSYSLIAPRARLVTGGTNDLVWCPIHQQVAFSQGNTVRTRRVTDDSR
jgi:hypothetical protein